MKDFKGMFKDTGYLKNPEGTWQNAKNILLTKQYNSPVNENGTKFNHLIEGEVCGIIETNKEIVYFSIIPTTFNIEQLPYNSIISVYNYNTKEVEQRIKGMFNFNRPIEGVYKYDYKENLIIAFSDGVFEDSNTPKVLNLTNSTLPLIGGVLTEENNALIELFPNTSKGNIEASTTEGSIKGIIAYATFKYGRDNEETTFKDLNTYAHIQEISTVSSSNVTKGIKLNLTELEYSIYDYIKIGLHIVGETEDNSYISPRISIYSAEKEIIINNILNYKSISNEELLIPKGRFSKIESMSLHKESILGLNVSTLPEFKFQKYANLLKIIPKNAGLVRPPNIEVTRVYDSNDCSLLFNEVYSFNIQLELNNGKITEWFHIPNIKTSDAETLNIWNTAYKDTYELVDNRFDEAEGYLPSFRLVNTGGYDNFGYWENKETYPNDDEYNSAVDYDGSSLEANGGVDLRGKPITYHRIMEEPRENTGKSIKDSFAVIGASIINFNVIPIEVRKQIRNVRLGIVKRGFGNSLIIAEGLATPSSPQEKLNQFSYITAAKNHSVNVSPIITDTDSRYTKEGTPFNHFLFLSPEIEEIKPLLSINTIYFKRLVYGQQHSYDNNSTGTLLGKTNDVDAHIIGSVEDVYNKNKYYNAPFSYNYKLPNNPSQGSRYIDGGLFINNETSINNYPSADSFLPVIWDNTNLVSYNKLITTDNVNEASYNTHIVGAIVNVMSFKDNLYSLQETNIIASKNSIPLINNSLSEPLDAFAVFKIGDVSYAKVSGGLAYTIVNNSSNTNYASCAIDVKLLSAFSSSLLTIKDTVYKDDDILDVAIVEHEVKLEGKSYGYELTGNVKNASVNSLANYITLDIFKDYISTFPYQIIRSSLAPNEGFVINAFRKFYVNNYYQISSGKGDGVAIRSNDKEVFVQMRFTLLHFQLKDSLKTQDADIALQSRDIFDIRPVSVTDKPEGYIGSEHKFACKLIKEGYFTIDHKQGNIIVMSKTPLYLPLKGLRNELSEELEFEAEYTEVVNGITKAIDNPYKYIGFSVGVDEKNNRIFISKLYPTLDVEEVVEDKNYYYKELLNKVPPSSYNKVLKSNYKNFTLSFSIDFDFWVCYHDFASCMFIGFKRHLYSLKNVPYGTSTPNTATIHTMNIGKKGEYFALKNPAYIDLIFNKEPNLSKSLYNIILHTESFIKRHNNLKATNKTISKIFIFSDKQASNILELDLSNKDVIREVEGEFRINNIRDILKSPELPILDKGGDIVEANLNNSKNWFDKSYFIGKFIVVRLIWSNDVQDDIYVNEVNAVSKISKR